MQVKELLPIFILNTKSFWLGIAPAVLTLLDIMVAWGAGDPSAAPVATALAAVLGWATGWTADDIHRVMVVIAPIYTLIVAQQRSGITRPYAATPSASAAKPAGVLVKDVSPMDASVVRDIVADAVAEVQ